MRLLRSIVLVAAVTAGVLSPTAAHADVFVGYDLTRDVKFLPPVPDDGSSGGDFLGAPNRVIGDITRLRAEHTRSKVRVSMQYRALPAAGRRQVHNFWFTTSAGRQVAVIVVATKGRWLGRATFLGASGGPSTCPRLLFRIDYVNHRAIVEVPRTCLGNPTWVKVAGSIAVTGAYGGFYSDDALAATGGTNTASPKVPL